GEPIWRRGVFGGLVHGRALECWCQRTVRREINMRMRHPWESAWRSAASLVLITSVLAVACAPAASAPTAAPAKPAEATKPSEAAKPAAPAAPVAAPAASPATVAQ